MTMRYLSLFSGIEAATVAWQSLNWQAVAFAEIEPFPCAVLAHHYPGVPNLGDVTQITDRQIAALGAIDIVVGGSPCQNLSIAGNRQGLRGKHSSLFYKQIRIFNAARKYCGARWLVWENVPGAFSSQRGADFACVVGALAGCNLAVPETGWETEGVALGSEGFVEWALLDAQWFNLAQRRKRLFAVLDTGNWHDRPPVLLERDSLRGDIAPRRKAKAHVAAAHQRGATAQCEVAKCLNAGGMGRLDYESETFVVHGSQDPDTLIEQAHTRGRNQGRENAIYIPPVRGSGDGQSLEHPLAVRRLTPVECERLQGFPDNYTRVPLRGKPAEACPDSPRYKALGNSMAVPVMRWIGQQIAHKPSLTEQIA